MVLVREFGEWHRGPMPSTDEDRDRGRDLRAKEQQNRPANPQNPRQRRGLDSSVRPSERTAPPTAWSQTSGYRTVKEPIAVLYAAQLEQP